MALLDPIFIIFGRYGPNMLGALAVLIIGWMIAFLVSSAIGKALKRTGLDEKILREVRGEKGSHEIESEKWISKLIYYLLLFFVFVAFFQVLGLTLVAEPLNQLLNIVFAYIPKLFAALVLGIIAWIIATLLKKLVLKVLQTSGVDEGLGSKAGLDKSEVPLSQTIAEVAFFLVLLLFLPMILNALDLKGLLEPLQLMMAKILGFLPNLLAAAIILAVGWLLARILQKIAVNLLMAMGSERLSQRVGLSKVLGSRGLAGIIGLVVYILVLIPMLIAALQALAIDAITQPFSNMLSQMLAILPNLFAAALILAASFILAKVISELIIKLLAGMGFDSLPERLGIGRSGAEMKRTPSQLAGYLVVAAVMLFALVEAAQMLKFAWLAEMIHEFTIFAGHVLMGMIILAVGIYLANLAFNAVASSGISNSKLPAHIARIAILVFAGAMALRQMGLANEIINLAFGLLLGALAVAVALAFGLGGKEIAAQEIRKWLEDMR